MKYSCYKHKSDVGIEKQSLLREIYRLACLCSKITHHVAPYPLSLETKYCPFHSYDQQNEDLTSYKTMHYSKGHRCLTTIWLSNLQSLWRQTFITIAQISSTELIYT